MPFLNCAESTIAPYTPTLANPWDTKKAQHLYRRIQFGANTNMLKQSFAMNPIDLVNRIVDDAVALPLAEQPEWAYWQLNNYSSDKNTRDGQVIDQIIGWGKQWVIDMKNNGLRDKMSWFWSGHFVTRLDDYGCPSWMYQYHKLLQKYALGNFKEFVHEMGITPAMLIFLNGTQNTKYDPNENYGRELYELFTLGVDNGYTQQDIVETSRALSGWNGIDYESYCGTVEFLPQFWDSGEKTIFGRTGKWGYDDVVNILFEERAVEISEYICGKLYKHFINPKVDEIIIEELAITFRNNNFEIAPVLKQLFKSAHFFDEANIGTIIPGHIEYSLNFLSELGYENNDELLFYLGYSANDFGERIFNPPNVAGWDGNRNWVYSSSLVYRWAIAIDIMGYYYQLEGQSVEILRQFAIDIVGDQETDPAVVTRKIVDFMLPKGLQFESEYLDAIAAFKADVPDNYFTDGSWNLYWEYAAAQVYFLIKNLIKLPEFQLK